MAEGGTDRAVNVRLNLLNDRYKAALAESAALTKGFSAIIHEHIGSATGRFGPLGSEAGKALSGITSGASVATLGLGALAVGVGALALEGVKSFVELGSEIRNFQRVSGASAEVSSEWVAISKDLGLSTETTATGVFRLSKAINGHADVLKADGIEIAKTKDGHVDLTATLLNVGDAYKKAGTGVEGNKIAFDAFGRSGKELLPVLGKTREELQKFIEEARKHGEVFSQADLQRTYDYKLAMHGLSEAVGGLERSIGAGLVPALARGAKDLADFIDKAQTGAEWLNKISGGRSVVSSGFATGPTQAQGIADLAVKQGRMTQLEADRMLAASMTAKQAAENVAKGLAHEQEAADAAAKEIKALEGALDGYVRSQTAVSGATTDFQARLQGLATGLRDNGSSLDAATTAGNANRKAMDGLVDSADNVAKTMVKQGASADDVQRVMAAMAAKLVATATAYGVPADEAQRFADIVTGLGDALKALPDSTHTTVNVDTEQASRNLATLIDQINLVDRAQGEALARMAVINNDPEGATKAANTFLTDRTIADLHSGSAAPPIPKTGGGNAAAAAERALDAQQRAYLEQVTNLYKTGAATLDQYLAALDDGMSRETVWTDAWVKLQDQKTAALQANFRKVNAGSEQQQHVEDLQAAAGMLTNDRYRSILEGRLNTWEQFSDGWWAVNDKIAKIDQADAAARKKATDDAAADMQKANDQLKQALLNQAAILDTQFKTLQARRDALFAWADPHQQVKLGWANSTSALTKNIVDQTNQLREWGTLMAQLEGRGLSSSTIGLLGVDKGPTGLAELRSLAKSSGAELAKLNAGVADRSQLAEALAIAQPAPTVNVAVYPTFLVDGSAIPVNLANLAWGMTQLKNRAEMIGQRPI
jgi:biotin operon repressor